MFCFKISFSLEAFCILGSTDVDSIPLREKSDTSVHRRPRAAFSNVSSGKPILIEKSLDVSSEVHVFMVGTQDVSSETCVLNVEFGGVSSEKLILVRKSRMSRTKWLFSCLRNSCLRSDFKNVSTH